MKRMQQILSKKNTSSLSDSSRNAKTNQLTGEDRITRITDAEVFCLLTWNANTALKEFFSTRADNNVNRNIMRNKIAEEGYCSLEEVEATNIQNAVKSRVNQDINKTTVNTIDMYFIAAGIKTDLVNKSYDLASTDKIIKDKAKEISKL
jgi:hypothetical protein